MSHRPAHNSQLTLLSLRRFVDAVETAGLDRPGLPDCQFTFSSVARQAGVITSPQRSLPSNHTCTWQFQVATTHTGKMNAPLGTFNRVPQSIVKWAVLKTGQIGTD